MAAIMMQKLTSKKWVSSERCGPAPGVAFTMSHAELRKLDACYPSKFVVEHEWQQ